MIDVTVQVQNDLEARGSLGLDLALFVLFVSGTVLCVDDAIWLDIVVCSDAVTAELTVLCALASVAVTIAAASKRPLKQTLSFLGNSITSSCLSTLRFERRAARRAAGPRPGDVHLLVPAWS